MTPEPEYGADAPLVNTGRPALAYRMSSGRELRADARRNRARVLAAADAVFAASGVAASTDEIARAAGVGIGTVFRHFPTKEALLTAVLVARLEALATEAEALRMANDPGVAFFTFLTRVVGRSAGKNLLLDAVTTAGVDVDGAVAPVRIRLLEGVGTLLTRAQQAGAVRTDAQAEDLIAVIVGAARTWEHTAGQPEIQQRTLQFILDGLRPGGSASGGG